MPLRDVAAGAAMGGSAAALAVLGLMHRYLKHELATPELIHAPAEELDLVEKRLLHEVKLLLRDYWPHPILEFSGLTSSAYSGFWAMLPSHIYPGAVEELILEDGGTVSLHWSEKPLAKASGGFERIVLCLPGLNNDSRTGFIQEAMQHWREAGFHAVTLNYRGCGGLAMTSKRFGCFDSWQDIAPVLQHIEEKHPGATLFGMGWSMGGMLLLRHLAEHGSQARIKAAVTVAAPVDLPATTASLESTIKKRLMNFAMANGVKLNGLAVASRSSLLSDLPVGALMRCTNLRQMDELTIVPRHGYKNADEYYSQNSPHLMLHRISVPTLLVNAADDPVVSSKTLPLEDIKQNPRMFLAITRRGGHIGWGSGGLGAAAWTDNMATDFMRACTARSKL